MKPVARVYTFDTLFTESIFQTRVKVDGKWVPARPLGYMGLQLKERLRCAWLAFTGKCDLVEWPGGQ